MSEALSPSRYITTTKNLAGMKVYREGKKGPHKVGRIHNFVFHPTERKLVGFLVKRPDAAMMFHRKDLFVRVGGLTTVDNQLFVLDQDDATDSKACKYLDVDFDACVLWWNMPLCTKSGKRIGHVDMISFDWGNGQVKSLTVTTGATNDALLGRIEIPSDLILGFKPGIGEEKAETSKQLMEEEIKYVGAILVDDSAANLATEGGVMEKAGHATAKATHKVRVVKTAAKPKVDEAAAAASAAAEKGLYAAGRQIGRTKGMFASFKEEYEKARHED